MVLIVVMGDCDKEYNQAFWCRSIVMHLFEDENQNIKLIGPIGLNKLQS